MIRSSRTRLLKDADSRSAKRGEAIKKILPFTLPCAEAGVKEIADECDRRAPCRASSRATSLGKTIVAHRRDPCAENGYQTAIMAPTEILAEQHYFSFRNLLTPLGYRIDLSKGASQEGEDSASPALRGRDTHSHRNAFAHPG